MNVNFTPLKEEEYVLDINDYSFEELLVFLNLSKTYTNETLDENIEMVKLKIINDETQTNYFKDNFLIFINNARKILYRTHSQQYQQPTHLLPLSSSQENNIYKDNIHQEELNYPKTPENHPLNPNLNNVNYTHPTNTIPTTVARGNLNNLERRTYKKYMSFDTLNRVPNLTTTSNSTYISNCTFELQYKLKDVVSTRLVNIKIPDNSIYLFNAYNNTNCFFITEDVTNYSGLIQIPEGNYTATELSSMVQLLINNTLGGTNYSHFSVSINNINNRTIITNNTNTFTISFLNDNTSPYLYKNIGWVLGFRHITYNEQNTYISEGLFNGGCEILYFSLNDYSKAFSPDMIINLNNSYIDDNILGKLEYNTDNSIIRNNIYVTRNYFGTIDINKLHVKLLNKYGDLVELNNMNYTFVLEFEIAYNI